MTSSVSNNKDNSGGIKALAQLSNDIAELIYQGASLKEIDAQIRNIRNLALPPEKTKELYSQLSPQFIKLIKERGSLDKNVAMQNIFDCCLKVLKDKENDFISLLLAIPDIRVKNEEIQKLIKVKMETQGMTPCLEFVQNLINAGANPKEGVNWYNFFPLCKISGSYVEMIPDARPGLALMRLLSYNCDDADRESLYKIAEEEIARTREFEAYYYRPLLDYASILSAIKVGGMMREKAMKEIRSLKTPSLLSSVLSKALGPTATFPRELLGLTEEYVGVVERCAAFTPEQIATLTCELLTSDLFASKMPFHGILDRKSAENLLVKEGDYLLRIGSTGELVVSWKSVDPSTNVSRYNHQILEYSSLPRFRTSFLHWQEKLGSNFKTNPVVSWRGLEFYLQSKHPYHGTLNQKAAEELLKNDCNYLLRRNEKGELIISWRRLDSSSKPIKFGHFILDRSSFDKLETSLESWKKERGPQFMAKAAAVMP